jgi:hypothetical protein
MKVALMSQLSAEQHRLFEYVQDADLWRWQLPNSKAFHAGLGSMGLEYDATKNPHIFEQLLQLTVENVVDLVGRLASPHRCMQQPHVTGLLT